MIIAAAIKIADVICFIPRPARHHHVLHSLAKSFKARTDRGYNEEEQGFVTNDGEFLNRLDAMKHAFACGQTLVGRITNIDPNAYMGPKLYSEDLW
jgi:hypothetical protein